MEVYRDPAPMGEGYAYHSRRIYTKGEQVTCLRKPEAAVKVDELLIS